jgi:lysophospholipase L1-like esterase
LGRCSECPPFADPATAPRNALIRDYNTVISGGICESNGLFEVGLLSKNGIRKDGLPFAPPDLYSYFAEHPEEFSDNLHPNGTGYRSMADMWFQSLLP